MLNPDQAKRIAGIAKWVCLDDKYWNAERDVSIITAVYSADRSCVGVTPAGFFDLLRVCQERRLYIQIHTGDFVYVTCEGHIKECTNERDLPTTLALAILKALEDK